MVGTHSLWIILSSWRIGTFIVMECSSSFLKICLYVSFVSKNNITTLPFFWLVLACYVFLFIYFQSVCFLIFEIDFCEKSHGWGPCLLIYLDKFCFLITSFTFAFQSDCLIAETMATLFVTIFYLLTLLLVLRLRCFTSF